MTTPPFNFKYSAHVPELLLELKISLAISTYQAGKIIFISPKDHNHLISLPRTFDKPMGFDIQENQMVLATKDAVICFENSKKLASHYPKKKNTYDTIFIPRTTFHTGQVDLHDIAFTPKGIFAVNTSFSCICQIDTQHNFIPKWQPNFITDLTSEDRCHLNGMVLKDGTPKYITALGTTNTPQGWRENITKGGVLIDVTTDEIIFDQLAMPHSPMLYKGTLYGLLSATGQFVKFNTENKTVEIIKELNGFCRGLDIIEDYAFIAMSKLRKNSSTFAKLSFAEKANTAGIKIIHLPTKALVGEIIYTNSVDEIYEIKGIKNTLRPNILNTTNPIHKMALSTPNETFWAKEKIN
jgi:uncharacterized protein (TIGR03032 family)